MQVILLETIGKLGDLGDVVGVKSGYARNFLIPQNKAKPATETNVAEFEAIKADLKAKEELAVETAKTKIEAMLDMVCVIQANAGEEGKLFGSVTSADIVASLAKAGHKVEKRDINMPEAIHYIGEYVVSVTLHANISTDIKIVVEAVKDQE